MRLPSLDWFADRARCSAKFLALSFVFLATAAAAHAEPMTLQQAIVLALGHSPAMAIAASGSLKAEKSYQEVKDSFIPQLTVGSGAGYSYGFPLIGGAGPSIVNVNSSATVFNPAQRQFVKAARLEWNASRFRSDEQRIEAIQDTVLTYAELDKWTRKLALLQQQEAESLQAESHMDARIHEGIDAPIEAKKAKLATARLRLLRAEADGSSGVLRSHLAWLTGQPEAGIETVTSSIPGLHEADADADARQKAVSSSPAIKAADEHASAEAIRAKGEHRALLPSFDLVGQYALLSKSNNYDEFFTKFQRHNGNIGIALRVPIFNAQQKARAQGADADAARARQEADVIRNRIAEETARLRQAVLQLTAMRDVAGLESEVAQAESEAAMQRADAGTATFKELQASHQQADFRKDTLVDVEFDLTRARVQLLRATGELEAWVGSQP